MCCYGNCHSFLKFSENDIDFVEKFVRTELLKILHDKSARTGNAFNDNDMHIFFGNYQGSPEDFQILLGERKLLLAASREVNRLNETETFGDYLKFFTVPEKYAISSKNTDKFPVGLYFGKKNRNAMAHVPITTEVMTTQVWAKVEPLFDKFINSGLKAVRGNTKDIVKIVNFGTGIRADVICIFCTMNDVDIEALQKTIAVQYEVKRGSTSGCWNVTNLRKHLQRHLAENSSKHPVQEIMVSKLVIKANEIKSENKPNESTHDSQSDFNDEAANSIVVVLPENEKSVFFEQMTKQNLRMMRAALENQEHKKVMVLKNDNRFDTIDVVDVDPDGNCLYGACVHQLHAFKVGSKEHYQMVAELRKAVVDHISKNFSRYERVLKFRIEEEAEAKTGMRPDDVNETQCKQFVDEYLSVTGNWAGAESLMAISEIHQTNIVGFNEKDTYYFATGYNASYSRFIFIAYRMNSQSQFYHYNSVCGVNPELMYKCVDNLSKAVFNNSDGSQIL